MVQQIIKEILRVKTKWQRTIPAQWNNKTIVINTTDSNNKRKLNNNNNNNRKSEK